jgi:hypothetical protein
MPAPCSYIFVSENVSGLLVEIARARGGRIFSAHGRNFDQNTGTSTQTKIQGAVPSGARDKEAWRRLRSRLRLCLAPALTTVRCWRVKSAQSKGADRERRRLRSRLRRRRSRPRSRSLRLPVDATPSLPPGK